ncbi:hypothetical protein ABH973_000838 [Bradyrhizobium ottawaense]
MRPAVPATFADLPTSPGKRASAVSPPVSTVEMSPNTPAGSSASARCELISAKRIKAYKFDTRTLVDLDSIDTMFASLPEM